MNARYSIRREAEGLSLPFGEGGVAAIGAIALGVVGLLVPIAWLETISFQLYLDSITPAAAPPLGTTAKLVAALALALFGAVLGYVLAKAFGVTGSDFSLADLIARLRGTGAEDESDAPELRAVDRHPDAPARRPFSAARDIPARSWDDGEWGSDEVSDADDDDELVLDAQFEPMVDDSQGRAPVIATLPPGDQPARYAEREPMAWAPAPDSIDDYDLSPPDPADWESVPVVGPAREQPDDVEGEVIDWHASLKEIDSNVVEPAVASVPLGMARPAVAAHPPLDLSVARLDELIARLEAGLSRKGAPAAVSVSDVDIVALDPSDSRDAELDRAQPDANPAFPHDPALAAALSTLRKMNLRAG